MDQQHLKLLIMAPRIIDALKDIKDISRRMRYGGPEPEDLRKLYDSLEEATDMAAEMLEELERPITDLIKDIEDYC